MKQKSYRIPEDLLEKVKEKVPYIDNESELIRFALIHLLITMEKIK